MIYHGDDGTVCHRHFCQTNVTLHTYSSEMSHLIVIDEESTSDIHSTRVY
jgi:hypothetical protein